MPLQPGVRLGPYEIHSAIGAGGMGEVWKARDTTLGRDVAIKVLPEHFALDPDRLARFKREAQILASLNHPNIGAIHGFQETDGELALVLELVEGPTLADRIGQGALPIDEALPIAKQIAEALEAAHELGIIHRDLKPANIKLRRDGTVKVLDFGLAKAFEPVGAVASSTLSMSPTITSPAATMQGLILGTAAYMSPEQARGKPVDKRCDIWAFGCVLYEMLSGKRAFAGDGVSDTLATVLKVEPTWDALPAETPAAVRRLLRRALEKDRKERLPDIGIARIEIREALTTPDAEAARTVNAPRSRERLAWAAAAVVTLLIGIIGGGRLVRPSPAEAPELRLQIVTPDATGRFALSPDGRSLVFQASGRLWLRPLDAEAARPLTGADGGVDPFWSPDSRSVGFFADGKLKRLDVAGGPVQTVTDIQIFNGSATWNADGVILVGGSSLPIERVPAAGGGREAVTRVGAGQVDHRRPQFLPDGRHFLFFASGTPDVRGVYVGSLDSTDTRRVFEADAAGVLLPPDYALFVRRQTLFAHRLDLRRFEPVGEPFPVAAPVDDNVGGAAVSSSASGLLAYRAATTRSPRLMTWLDRTGRPVGTVGEPDADASANGANSGFRLSPNGGDVAFARTVDGNADVWLVDLTRNVRRRFTVDAAVEDLLMWSPDGSRLVFHSNRTGRHELYQKSVTGDARETLLLESSEAKNPSDWSRDGRLILYESISPKTGNDLWVVPVAGDRRPVPVVQTPFADGQGRFSPDSQWIAYRSDASGRQEIVLKRLSGAGRDTQVSTGGGSNVRWRGDGREILYRAPDNHVMAVAVTLPSEGTNVELGVPVPLFTLPAGSDWDVMPDGQRFLVNVPTGEATVPPITVVLNWHPGLTK